jgi:uncharacterized RDD family membrane protein YckC
VSATPLSPTVPTWCPACAKPVAGDARFCEGCGADLADPLAQLSATLEATEPRTGTELHYASFWQRLAAHLIDQAAIFAAAWFVGRPFGAMLGGFVYIAGSRPAWDVMSYVGALLVAVFTSFVFEVVWTGSHLQATPGKLALHLKVTDCHGKPLGFAHAFGRYLLKALSGTMFGIGFLIQPFTAKKQALHDLLAGTLVISR